MTLLSGNPDGFAFVLGFDPHSKSNRLKICCSQIEKAQLAARKKKQTLHTKQMQGLSIN
jgi:hypothetical protein